MPPSASFGRSPWAEEIGPSPAPMRAASVRRRIYTLIATAKLNDIDRQAWLADVLARLPDHPARRIHELLPWNWRPQSFAHAA